MTRWFAARKLQLDRSSYVRAFWVLRLRTARDSLQRVSLAAQPRARGRAHDHRDLTARVPQRIGAAARTARSGAPISRRRATGGRRRRLRRLSPLRITARWCLIADISGKGVDAAVLTAFIKFMIRAIALRQSDPAAILAEFNVAFSRAVGNPYLFVSMFVGVLDTEHVSVGVRQRGARLRLSCAGATACAQLAMTGPVLGVMEEPFSTEDDRPSTPATCSCSPPTA